MLRPGKKEISSQFRDTADGIFEHIAGTEMIGSEHRNHYVPGRALENPYVIADEREKIAGLMRNAIAGEISRKPRAVYLAAHHLQHHLARLFAHRFAFGNLFEQLADISRRAEAERSLRLPVEGFGI